MTVFNRVEYLDSYKQLDLPALDYAKEGDACIDLRSMEDWIIYRHAVELIPTGIRIAIPENSVMLIFPRSGLALNKGINMANGVGVIDSGYRGEIKLPLTCIKDEVIKIQAGDRVAQFFVMPIPKMICITTDDLDQTDRDEGGFGHTGIK